MAFWERNCAVLRQRYPLLLEEITGEGASFGKEGSGLAPQDRLASQDYLAEQDIQIETAASGAPVLKVKGVYVHSQRDPEREGRRLAETAGKGSGPVIILGFGLGYAAEAVAELAGERPLIIVEKYRELLRTALELRDLEKLLLRNNVAFIPGGSGEGITGALSLFEEPGTGCSAPAVIRNRPLTALDEEWYAAVEGRIRTWTMRDDVNTATLGRFGKRWVRNLSRNMSAVRDLPGISGFAGLAGAADSGGGRAAEALPVFLAAAGPGLDNTGPLLGEIRRRCLVVAVDTSLRFLLRHGVEPDFALVVDPQFWNSRHLDRCPCPRTILIAESAVYPPVLRLPFRGIYLCGSLFPLGSFIEQRVDPKGTLGAGGSVATTAWDFARILGGKDIWIAGLDLAFPGLKTHFKGALFEDRALAESGRLNPAETWLVRALRDGAPFPAPSASGTRVLTDRRLSLYAAWFENRFRQSLSIRNRSLSHEGLAIPGLETAAAETLLALPDRREEIDSRLLAACSRIGNAFFEHEEIRKRAERYQNALSVLLRGLEHIKAAACEGAAAAEKALKYSPNPDERRKILAALDRVTQSIAGSEVKEVAGFLFPPAETAAMNNTGASGENGATDPFRSYLTSAARLYRSLAEAAGFNLRELKKT